MNRQLVAGLVLGLLILGIPITITAGQAMGVSPGILPSEGESDEPETVPTHEAPGDHATDPDADAVAGALAGALGGQFDASAADLDQGDYDAAREHFDEDFDALVDQYGEAADLDDEELETIRETSNNTERLVELLERWDSTLEDYEAALADDETDQARTLARDLAEVAEELDELIASIDPALDDIEAVTGEAVGDADEILATLRDEIEETSGEVVQTQFVETTLKVEADGIVTSFGEPLPVSGTLETVDGDPVANETIELRLGNETAPVDALGIPAQTVSVTTDEQGTFSFDYQPMLAPVGSTFLLVEYRPAVGTDYLGSDDEMLVRVEQVEPSVTLEADQETAGIGDEVTVTGEVTAAGEPVESLGLTVSLADRQVETVSVENGTYEGTVTIPANVSAGVQDLVVAWPEADRALAPADASQELHLEETESSLTISGHPVDDEDGDVVYASVEGTLESTAGTPIANERVALFLDGAQVETVETDEAGEFEALLDVQDIDAESVTVEAAFDGSDSLFTESEAETTVSIGDNGDRSLAVWLLGGGLLAIGGLLGGYLFYRSRQRDEAIEDTPGIDEPSPTVTAHSTKPLLERARRELEADNPREAVQLGYAATRETLEAQLGLAGSLTHWEFYRACVDRAGDQGAWADDQLDSSLRETTESYERVVYGGATVDSGDAADLLERAERLLE